MERIPDPPMYTSHILRASVTAVAGFFMLFLAISYNEPRIAVPLLASLFSGTLLWFSLRTHGCAMQATRFEVTWMLWVVWILFRAALTDTYRDYHRSTGALVIQIVVQLVCSFLAVAMISLTFLPAVTTPLLKGSLLMHVPPILLSAIAFLVFFSAPFSHSLGFDDENLLVGIFRTLIYFGSYTCLMYVDKRRDTSTPLVFLSRFAWLLFLTPWTWWIAIVVILVNYLVSDRKEKHRSEDVSAANDRDFELQRSLIDDTPLQPTALSSEPIEDPEEPPPPPRAARREGEVTEQQILEKAAWLEQNWPGIRKDDDFVYIGTQMIAKVDFPYVCRQEAYRILTSGQ